MQKGRIRGLSHKGNTVAFGTFGLKALEPLWITNRQIEAARIAMTRYVKREGKVWIRIFPDNRLQKNLPKYGWVKEKGAYRTMLQLSNPDASFLKWMAFLGKRQRKHCALQLTNYLF